MRLVVLHLRICKLYPLTARHACVLVASSFWPFDNMDEYESVHIGYCESKPVKAQNLAIVDMCVASSLAK